MSDSYPSEDDSWEDEEENYGDEEIDGTAPTLKRLTSYSVLHTHEI
jgi:hypothetical protein